jgi:hypothetical protein
MVERAALVACVVGSNPTRSFMKKLILALVLLFPINSFASGMMLLDSWETRDMKRDWILVIKRDVSGKEIGRYGFWDYYYGDYHYYIKYQTYENDEAYRIKEVTREEWLEAREYGYYTGEE